MKRKFSPSNTVDRRTLNMILNRTDLVSTFPTKRTPIINVQFTPRNLCLVAGTYQMPDSR
jgi:hypothetical protein